MNALIGQYTAETCPDRAGHTSDPFGYLAWHEWAEKKGQDAHAASVPDVPLLGDLEAQATRCVGAEMSETATVAALYVETGGAYYGLEGVDPWDEARDARLYPGPWPVVAHPPCARWCRFARGIEKRYGYRVGDDGGCFEAALHAVRTYGGILEHPAHSLAWRAFDLPRPSWSGGWTQSLLDGGSSAYVEQERYGHSVRKATWLYAYGTELPELAWGLRPDQSGGKVRWARVRYKGDEDRPRVSAPDVARTPTSFRDELLQIARSACLCVPVSVRPAP